jgi:quercetin dioxygenase-like cupin family protein
MVKNNQSTFFEFKNESGEGNFSISEFKGWNGSLIIKLDIPKNLTIKDDLIISKHFDILNKEKIIVVTQGEIDFKLNNKSFLLKEFDAVNLFSNNSKYEIKSLVDSQIYIISAENLKPQKKDPIFFNFFEDIVPKDIWGGQCISRVFYGECLNIVLFDLKPGFKFHDEGHENEQITWVVKGEMDFYAKDLKKKLQPGTGVDIGGYDLHGGISNGAIGFDVFYPKRNEKKYK